MDSFGVVLFMVAALATVFYVVKSVFFRNRARSLKRAGISAVSAAVGLGLVASTIDTTSVEPKAIQDAQRSLTAATAPESAEITTTLGEFVALSKEKRQNLLASLSQSRDHPEDDLPHFMNCMADFAPQKNQDLLVKDVFGWCEAERENNRPKFTSHFNQLDARDLSSEAYIHCKGLVNNSLKAPSTAKHPWIDRNTFDHGRWRYSIRSYVDSQNSFGAMIRTKYRCEAKFNGSGDPLDPANWTFEPLEASE